MFTWVFTCVLAAPFGNRASAIGPISIITFPMSNADATAVPTVDFSKGLDMLSVEVGQCLLHHIGRTNEGIFGPGTQVRPNGT